MTEDLKLSMLHHVRYEITHCMVIPAWSDDAPILKEAVFLSFFVHARNLIHFFERERAVGSDDVYASDFGFKRVQLPISSDDRARFGKDMMHITSKRERHTAETKPWPIQTTYAALKPVARQFATHVVSHYAPRLPEQERHAWERLASILDGSGDSMIVVETEANKPVDPTPVGAPRASGSHSQD